jgi:outer membrane protein OmpA-like peptidoglycan-associated protein
MEKGFSRYGAASLLALVTTVGLTSGCATKGYVRTEVNTSADAIAAQMEEKDRALQQGIEGNTNQIGELSGVTREQAQQIASLDSELEATDGRVTEAKSTADQAVGEVNRLDTEFQNRNRYSTVQEQSIMFAFDSTTVDEESFATLDSIAERAKSSPNTILVLEGRTDGTGDETYNIQLGEKRLDAVIRYLVVEQDVPMQKIHKMSFGEARPVASNDTTEGRAQNRAVIMRLMEASGGGQGGSNVVSDAAPASR